MSPCLVLVLIVSAAAEHVRRGRKPPSFPGLRTVTELAAAGGYDVTDYEVITDDGYSLWLFRLGSNTGPPALVQHGVFLAADSWITRGPGKDLPFILLEDGFDVWLSNQRGTAFNEQNLYYNRSDPRFWDFSFHEAGLYDLPAFIDTILKVRRRKQLFYIGISLGTTVFLVMTSSRPEYNSKIQAAVLLSPVAYTPSFADLPPPVKIPTQYSNTIQIRNSSNTAISQRALRAAGVYEVFERTPNTIRALKMGCTFGSSTLTACLDLLMSGFGEHRTNLDPEQWNGFIPYAIAGTSLKTLYHTLQLYGSGQFKEFDYGPEKNLEVYGSRRPPDYKIGQITAPVALFWCSNDPLLSTMSVGRLAAELPHLIFSRKLPDPKCNHIDVIIGMDANQVLYSKVTDVLKSFSQNKSCTRGKFFVKIKEIKEFLTMKYWEMQRKS